MEKQEDMVKETIVEDDRSIYILYGTKGVKRVRQTEGERFSVMRTGDDTSVDTNM